MTKTKHFRFFLAVVALLIATGIVGVYEYYNNIRIQSKISAGQVASIRIFDGNTGKQYVINNREAVSHIVANLNNRIFYRDISTKNYSGFSYSTSFLNKSGKSIFSCTINSNDTMIYNDYFYKDPSSGIDFNYINKFLENQTSV